VALGGAWGTDLVRYDPLGGLDLVVLEEYEEKFMERGGGDIHSL